MNIANVNPERNYWFIRTEGGLYYDEFIVKFIVAIDWNEINDLELIQKAATDEEASEILEKMIKKIYPDEKRYRNVARQIKYFVNNVKKGDIVLIPSVDSWRITFGEVQTNELVPIPEDYDGKCDWEKRKAVKWLKTVERRQLDPYLFQLFYSQHTVTNASPYAHFIDRTLNSFFIKGDKAHLILEVRKKEDILANDLIKLINGIFALIDVFNKETDSNLDKNSIGIKINVQSPGPVELIAGAGIIMAIGMMLHYIMGGRFDFIISTKEFRLSGETEGLIQKIIRLRENSKNISQESIDRLNEIKSAMEKLEVKIPKEIVRQEDEEFINK